MLKKNSNRFFEKVMNLVAIYAMWRYKTGYQSICKGLLLTLLKKSLIIFIPKQENLEIQLFEARSKQQSQLVFHHRSRRHSNMWIANRVHTRNVKQYCEIIADLQSTSICRRMYASPIIDSSRITTPWIIHLSFVYK